MPVIKRREGTVFSVDEKGDRHPTRPFKGSPEPAMFEGGQKLLPHPTVFIYPGATMEIVRQVEQIEQEMKRA